MKRNELVEARDLSTEDLADRIGDAEKRLFTLKFQMVIEGAQKSEEYIRARKSLAQYKTLAREQELARHRMDTVAQDVRENG